MSRHESVGALLHMVRRLRGLDLSARDICRQSGRTPGASLQITPGVGRTCPGMSLTLVRVCLEPARRRYVELRGLLEGRRAALSK